MNLKRKPRALFITGIAGFIGSTVAERILSTTELQVVGVDNFHPYYPKFLKLANLTRLQNSPRFHFHEASFEDKDVWSSACSRFEIEAVVHLAAYAGIRPSLEDPQGYYQNNVLNTLQLLDHMRSSGVQDLVFTSSSSVYGGNKELPFTEGMRVDQPISPYAATKKAGEELIATYCHLYGMRATALRLFTVYGPRQRPDLAIRKFLLNVHRGVPITLFGMGDSKRDYTHVTDVVDAYMGSLKALKTFAPGHMEAFNIGSGRAITLLEMVQTIEQALNKKAILQFSERHPADLEVTLADISKARDWLGYQPRVEFLNGVCSLRDWLFSDPTFQQDINVGRGSHAVNWRIARGEKLRDWVQRVSRATGVLAGPL